MTRIPARMALTVALLSAAAAGPAFAAKIEVSPVTIELPAGSASTVLTVTNRGEDGTSIQVRGFTWSQTTTQDPLQPTHALLVSPPMFELKPGESQTVRILLRTPASVAEASYRILVDELPSAGAASTIRFPLRLSLPVFAEPAGAAAPRVAWHVATGSGGAELVAANSGNKRERVTGMAVQTPSGPVNAKPLENAWVLPNTERHWSLPGPVAGPGSVHLTGQSEAGKIDTAVPVQRGG